MLPPSAASLSLLQLRQGPFDLLLLDDQLLQLVPSMRVQVQHFLLLHDFTDLLIGEKGPVSLIRLQLTHSRQYGLLEGKRTQDI